MSRPAPVPGEFTIEEVAPAPGFQLKEPTKQTVILHGGESKRCNLKTSPQRSGAVGLPVESPERTEPHSATAILTVPWYKQSVPVNVQW